MKIALSVYERTEIIFYLVLWGSCPNQDRKCSKETLHDLSIVRICIFGSCHSEFTTSLQWTIIVLKENLFNMNPWDLRLSKQQRTVSLSLSLSQSQHRLRPRSYRDFLTLIKEQGWASFKTWKHFFSSFVCISNVSRWSGRRWVRGFLTKLPTDWNKV